VPLTDFEPLFPDAPAPRRNSSDLYTSLKVGVQQLPGAAVGLLDLPSAAVFGTRPYGLMAEQAGEFTGFQPGRWAEETARRDFSPEYWQQQRNIGRVYDENVEQNQGVLQEALDIIRASPELAYAYATNPRYTLNQVAQSLPSMLAGGVVGRGLMGVGTRAGAEGVPVGALERAVGTRWASPIAGGAGEGVVAGGAGFEQAAQTLGPGATPEQLQRAGVASGASGLFTGGIGVVGGRLAQRYGLETPETLIAGGRRVPVHATDSWYRNSRSRSKKRAGRTWPRAVRSMTPARTGRVLFAKASRAHSLAA
jgi:hypothetical protein